MTQTIAKPEILKVQKLNTVKISLKKPVSIVKQWSIADILKWTETPKTAIAVIEVLEFFLKTNQDRKHFLDEYESRRVWQVRKGGLALINLAKDVGSFYYKFNSYDELEQMNIQDAL